jgi:hypothetical protein
MTVNPPKEFVSALRQFDADLRIRWALRTKLWYIERKLPERHRQLLSERPNPWKSERGFDLYDGWKEGWVHVLSVHPDLLDHRVFEVLARADSYRQGGFKEINRRLDEALETWEAETDRAIDNWTESASKDAADRMPWLQGRRVVVP